MAITVSFNGSTLRKPGSYSKVIINLGGNFPIAPVGVVGLIGEAPRGKPGSAEIITNNVFNAAQTSVMRDKYGPGSQLADAASLAFNPSSDGLIANGAQAIYAYKTNASTQASTTIPTSYGTAKALEYGEGGNLTALTIEESTAESLPSLGGLHYLPSTSASSASDFQASANGGTKQNFGVIAGYAAAAGGPDAFVTAAAALTNISASGGASTALFSGTDNTTELTVTNSSGTTSFVISSGAGSFGSCAIGDLFVLAGLATASFNGVYLCTSASTATTLAGVKLKDLAANTVTAPVPGSETFGAANTDSRSFTALSISTDTAQAEAQGASLQLSFLNNRVYGGTAKTPLSTNIGNVGTIRLSGSFAAATVTITGGTWVQQPQAGDICWILPDSQLAASNANCGAYYVTASTQSTVTMTKVDQGAGTFTTVTAVTITAAGVTKNLRVFAKAQTTPNYAGVIGSSAESKRIFTIENTRDEITEVSDEVGGTIAFKLGYGNASATAATCTINQSTKRLTTAITGVSSVDLNINLLQYPTLAALASYINAQTGYKAEVDSAFANLSPLNLDAVTALGILSLGNSPVAAAGRIKKDKYDVKGMFDESSILAATITATKGLPSALSKTFLAGGIVGATASSAIVAALDEFEKVRINTVVPLFSRDASADIAEGKTDESSSYLIDSIHAAVKSHCILMSNTKNKSERHCALAYRGSYVDTKEKAANLSSFRAQLLFQDVLALSTTGDSVWMQPHMLAALTAGMRSGAQVGLPLTFKFYNITGLRHTQSALDEIPEDVVIDFEPRTQYDDAIDAGLTFLENPPSGGFRMVVDNTTYTKDDNWVFNRLGTVHASDVVVYDFRTRLENTITGARNTDWTPVSVRSLCEGLLTGYKGQGLLGSTAEAPNGFSNLSVQLEGNTFIIDATVILVEGIDFVLNTITLKRNTSAA
jgi:hypothetical protein